VLQINRLLLQDQSCFLAISENETEQQETSFLLSKSRYVSAEFDLSASDNLITPSIPILLSV
jgi:hypothetical protein